MGGGDLDKFIAKVEKGLNKKTSLDYLNKIYEKGKMNQKQLMTYSVVLNEAYEKDKSEKVGKELDAVLKEKDKMKKEYWPILERSPYGSDNFKLVLNNIGTFNKNIGKEKVDKYLTSCYTNAINNTMRPNTKEPLKVLQQIQEELTKLDLADQATLTRSLELNQACLEKNINKVIELAGQVESNKNGELWSIFNAINSVRGNISKEDLNKIIVLEDKFLGFADENGKTYIKNYFENLKIAAHVGVYFQDLSYEDALAKAKQQGRKLFIDCYTTWCGPCKY
ncbi:MAG TPA: thioredoxin family protein, partial [Butyricimonas virosa]|nr:thioredoxin family protein [Butyricimonas virosa]